MRYVTYPFFVNKRVQNAKKIWLAKWNPVDYPEPEANQISQIRVFMQDKVISDFQLAPTPFSIKIKGGSIKKRWTQLKVEELYLSHKFRQLMSRLLLCLGQIFLQLLLQQSLIHLLHPQHLLSTIFSILIWYNTLVHASYCYRLHNSHTYLTSLRSNNKLKQLHAHKQMRTVVGKTILSPNLMLHLQLQPPHLHLNSFKCSNLITTLTHHSMPNLR